MFGESLVDEWCRVVADGLPRVWVGEVLPAQCILQRRGEFSRLYALAPLVAKRGRTGYLTDLVAADPAPASSRVRSASLAAVAAAHEDARVLARVLSRVPLFEEVEGAALAAAEPGTARTLLEWLLWLRHAEQGTDVARARGVIAQVLERGSGDPELPDVYLLVRAHAVRTLEALDEHETAKDLRARVLVQVDERSFDALAREGHLAKARERLSCLDPDALSIDNVSQLARTVALLEPGREVDMVAAMRVAVEALPGATPDDALRWLASEVS